MIIDQPIESYLYGQCEDGLKSKEKNCYGQIPVVGVSLKSVKSSVQTFTLHLTWLKLDLRGIVPSCPLFSTLPKPHAMQKLSWHDVKIPLTEENSSGNETFR